MKPGVANSQLLSLKREWHIKLNVSFSWTRREDFYDKPSFQTLSEPLLGAR